MVVVVVEEPFLKEPRMNGTGNIFELRCLIRIEEAKKKYITLTFLGRYLY